LVRGAQTWYEQGLQVPQAVADATATYQHEMDTLGAFLEEECLRDPQAWVLATDLYKRYVEWCNGNGEQPMKQTGLGLRLAERGFTPGRRGPKQARTWSGLRLPAPDEGPQTRAEGQTRSDPENRLSSDDSFYEGVMPKTASERVYTDDVSGEPSDDGVQRHYPCPLCGQRIPVNDEPCPYCTTAEVGG
jgi:phage/plasmid-associated DNA primase